MENDITCLISTYRLLCDKAAILAESIRLLEADAWGAWVLPRNLEIWSTESAAHALAAEIYTCFEHRSTELEGRETWQLPGLLAVPEQVIHHTTAVNTAKEQFEQHVKAFLDGYRASPTQSKRGRERAARLFLREALLHAGMGRLHYRHVTRRIITLTQPAEAISLSWVEQQRSITVITANECQRRLQKLNTTGDDLGILKQLDTLNRLTVSELQRLRVVQTPSTALVKALAYIQGGDKQHLGYLAMPALLQQNNRALPLFTTLSETPTTKQRLRPRADKRIIGPPLLPSIRVHLSL